MQNSKNYIKIRKQMLCLLTTTFLLNSQLLKFNTSATQIEDSKIQQNELKNSELNLAEKVVQNLKQKGTVDSETLFLDPIDCLDETARQSIKTGLAQIVLNYSEQQKRLLDFKLPNNLNSLDDALQLIQQTDPESAASFSYAVHTKKIQTQPLIGCASVQFYKCKNSPQLIASLSVFLDLNQNFGQKGYGTEILTKLSEELLNQKEIKQLYWSCFDENLASKNLATKVFKNLAKNNNLSFYNRMFQLKEMNNTSIFEANLIKN